MLQRKNEGSILITSLITFSIISLICITCSSLILSNNRISELEYKREQLKELNLGAIELIESNILKEIKSIEDKVKTEEEFYDYMIKNDNLFISKIINIKESKLKNTSIQMALQKELSDKEFLYYKISSKSQINNHKRYTFIKLKIKNPYKEVNGSDEEEKDENLITFYDYEEK